MSKEKTKFLDMFPECGGLTDLCGGLESAYVLSVTVDKTRLVMSLSVSLKRPPSASEKEAICSRIAANYGLSAVVMDAEAPKQERGGASEKGALLYGKEPRGKTVHMDELGPESGSVTVSGEVFSAKSREIQRSGAAVLSFEMTDHTGSVQVSKYLRPNDDRSIIEKIKPGMCLKVSGAMAYNRFEDDIVLEPAGIAVSAREERCDGAPEKRVELHAHTRYSALDALMDPAGLINRAARWGHPAVAITDHGVAQAFPEAWKAGKKAGIKVIYGIEGYLVNDVDDHVAVRGTSNVPIDHDFVAFDLETTGLSPTSERITEIGAVLMRGGEIAESFCTFVNPGRPVPPEITKLTGITDADVKNALSEGAALKAFLDFAGDRPLVAHNAGFDLGFLSAAAERSGVGFGPVCADTLVLSQALLPNLKRYRLDAVAEALNLPKFEHHRASDDAATAGRIMSSLIESLKKLGVERLDEVNAAIGTLAGGSSAGKVRHVSILVKDKTGLKNLYKLISLAHLEHFRRNPIIPKSVLKQHREGLLIGSACSSGELFSAIVEGKNGSEVRRIASFYDYLEIMPLGNNRFLVDNGNLQGENSLKDAVRRIVALGRELHKPVCATGDAHFLDPEDEKLRRILLAGKKYADADKPMPIYFRTTAEMLEEFLYLGEETAREVVIGAPNRIAALCGDIELLPEGLFVPAIENSAEDLSRLVSGRMEEIYGENPPEIVRSRAQAELNDILGRHYDVIYMSAQKLVADSIAHGYLVGSRGSVGSSIVAFLSGITEVNSLPPHYICPSCRYSEFGSGKEYGCGADMPDKNCPHCGTALKKDGFDIPFETFLGFGGDKVPDIDLNFSGEYQAQAHKYTEELFGSDHVFRAGTIGTLAEKTAYGYVKAYLEERGLTVSKAEENRLALGLVGVKRTTGQHPGGLVVIPQDREVTDFCPVQHPADDAGSGIITTHFEYHSMEDNLLKLDELGHDDPTMIRMLEDMTGVNAREIPLDDPETMRIFRSATPLGLTDDDPIIGQTGTIGIPEFGTGFTRQMLLDTQPSEFATLVRLSGFSHGTDVWLGNAKELILSGTASVKETIGCRDDIMLYLISRGINENRAFKIMESVRKGRGLPEGAEDEMKKAGVPDWYIESCKKIKYLFPKAHAVAYVMMAFRIAWFKVHRPLPFYSAYFYRRSQKDAFDAEIMLGGIDAVRRKVNELKLRQNLSAKEEDLLVTLEAVYEFYLRGFRFEAIDLYRSDAVKFLITGDTALLPPFVAVSGLGDTAANDLVSCRESGREFVSEEELSAHCPKVSSAHLEQLRTLGALGNLPRSSQISLFDTL